MKQFEIFFSDLNEQAQKKLLEVVGASDPKEMNWDIDIIPLAVYEFEDEDDEELVEDYTCPLCECEFAIKFTPEESEKLYSYKHGGGLLQDVFPELNPMEREVIKTHYCPDCQKMLFGSEYKSDRIVFY